MTSTPSSPESTFHTTRFRDASGAIRGFVYQADQTIEEWLSLESNEELELECGEDIDRVTLSFGTDPIEQSRSLEQVKHHEESLTLNSAGAVSALACYVEHCQTNPRSQLKFRYLTNAPIGKERRPTKEKETAAEPGSKEAEEKQTAPLLSAPALHLWKQLQTASAAELPPRCDQQRFEESEMGGALRVVRAAMRNGSRPLKLPEATWQNYQEWLSNVTDGLLIEFICSFEWSTDAPQAHEMGVRIRHLLVERSFAQDGFQAAELYSRLFLHVFKLLAHKGDKRLTRADLDVVLAQPTMSERDQAQWADIGTRIMGLDERLSSVEEWRAQEEERRHQQDERVAQIGVQIQSLLGVHTSTALTQDFSPPLPDVPSSVEHLTRRGEVVQQVIASFASNFWLAIEGDAGSGKTQLSILLAHAGDLIGATKRANVWLSLRGCTVDAATRRLDAACASLAGPVPLRNRRSWYEKFCQQLGEHGLIVLDDLPRLSDGDALCERLITLAQACRAHHVRLLSNSHHALPTELREHLNPGLHPLFCPRFSVQETRDLLHAHGAPDGQIDPTLTSFLRDQTGGHPILLTAAARFLRERDWRLDEEEWDALRRSEYATSPNVETVKRLVDTLTPDGRELLLRLNLLTGDFAMDAVRTVALVSPTVARPQQQLTEMLGLWVQRDSRDHLSVSPLVRALGSDDLLPGTRRACHLELAASIVRRKTLNQLDLLDVISHLASGESFDAAGAWLAWGLGQLWTRQTPIHDSGLLSLWWDLALPDGMSLDIQLLVRSHQIALGHARSRECAFTAHELERLMQLATPKQGWAVFSALYVAGKALAERDFVNYCHFLERAIPCVEQPIYTPDGEELKLPADAPTEGFLWFHVTRIETVEHLQAWLGVIEGLSSAQRRRALDDELAEEGSLTVSNRLWLLETDKPASTQNWPKVSETLQNLAERAWRFESKLLWACAVRAHITVESEHLNDFEAALRIGREALRILQGSQPKNWLGRPRGPVPARALFLIQEVIGRACGFHKRHEEAVGWLSASLRDFGTQDTAFALKRMQAWLCLSNAAASQTHSDSKMAITSAHKAVELSRSSADISALDRVKALGELAVAHTLEGNLSAAFEPMHEAGRLLLDHKQDSDSWRDLVVLYGHVSGYLCSSALLGAPPPGIWKGEGYAVPRRSMFLSFHPERVAFYNLGKERLLPIQLAMFAEGVGRDDEALWWAEKAKANFGTAKHPVVIAALSSRLIPHSALNDRLIEALDLAWVQAKAFESGALSDTQSGPQWPGPRSTDPEAPPDIEALLNYDSSLNESLGDQTTDHASPDDESVNWSETQRLRIGIWTLLLGVLPIAFRLALLRLENKDLSHQMALDAVRWCREKSAIIAVDDASDDHNMLQHAAEALSAAFVQTESSNTLIKRGNACGPDEAVLKVVFYLGATLREDVQVTTAIEGHLLVLPVIESWLRTSPATYRLLIAPVFFQFWQHQMESAPFNTFDPSKSALERVRRLPSSKANSPQAVKMLMLSIVTQMQANISLDALRWLSHDKDNEVTPNSG